MYIRGSIYPNLISNQTYVSIKEINNPNETNSNKRRSEFKDDEHAHISIYSNIRSTSTNVLVNEISLNITRMSEKFVN